MTATALNAEEFDILRVFMTAGADPNLLAQWVADNTETAVPVATLAAVAGGWRRCTPEALPDR